MATRRIFRGEAITTSAKRTTRVLSLYGRGRGVCTLDNDGSGRVIVSREGKGSREERGVSPIEGSFEKDLMREGGRIRRDESVGGEQDDRRRKQRSLVKKREGEREAQEKKREHSHHDR